MTFLDKVMFWKKKESPFGSDSLNLGGDTGLRDIGLGQDMGLGKPNLGLHGDTQFPPQQQPPGFQNPMSFQQPVQAPQYSQPQSSAPIMPAQPPPVAVGKDIEIVSSKLDALRATLDSINQRLANLERVAYGEQEKKRRW